MWSQLVTLRVSISVDKFSPFCFCPFSSPTVYNISAGISSTPSDLPLFISAIAFSNYSISNPGSSSPWCTLYRVSGGFIYFCISLSFLVAFCPSASYNFSSVNTFAFAFFIVILLRFPSFTAVVFLCVPYRISPVTEDPPVLDIGPPSILILLFLSSLLSFLHPTLLVLCFDVLHSSSIRSSLSSLTCSL